MDAAGWHLPCSLSIQRQPTVNIPAAGLRLGEVTERAYIAGGTAAELRGWPLNHDERFNGFMPTGQMTSRHAMLDARSRLTGWLVERALPLWAERGTDWQHGGFFEKLDSAAQPIDEPRRARVVARQVYVFATAARMGWHPDAATVVQHGLDFLLNRLRKPDGTFAAAVQPDGVIVRGGFDLYEHAFVLFALASAYRSTPSRASLIDVASELLAAMRSRWAHDEVGFEESSPSTLPLKSNPHMHLFEAALAWVEVAPAPAPATARSIWNDLADELAGLCLTRFIDPATGALREYFDHAWQPIAGPQGKVVEPGHQFEWAWLLYRWGQLRNRDDAITAAQKLIHIGENQGVDRSRNVAINELDDQLQPIDTSAKLWPQTERIKAWFAHSSRIGDTGSADAAFAKVTESIGGLSQFLEPASTGLWHEEMNPAGGFIAGVTRASSLYHIVCAIETLHGDSRRDVE